jgi:hypothetical protein
VMLRHGNISNMSGD